MPKTEYNLKEIEEYVFSNLAKKKSYETIQNIQNAYPETTFYIFGGAIRDILIKYFHNTKIKTKDFDIFIDDSKKNIQTNEFVERVEQLGFKHHLTLGGKPRCFEGKDFDLEFPLFSDNGFSNKKIKSQKDIFPNLDFYHNAGIFNFKTNELSIHEITLNSIKSKIIIPISEEKIISNSILTGRAILQKIKLGFSIDKALAKGIKRNINNISFKEMKKYMQFKKYDRYNQEIEETLQKIKNSN